MSLSEGKAYHGVEWPGCRGTLFLPRVLEENVLCEGSSVLKQSGRNKPGVRKVSSVKQCSGRVLFPWWKDNGFGGVGHAGAGCAVVSALVPCRDLILGAAGAAAA